MTTYLETRWGGGGENPNEAEMVAALAELATPDPEHPDCWLSDENGWVVAAHEGGRIVFEDSEEWKRGQSTSVDFWFPSAISALCHDNPGSNFLALSTTFLLGETAAETSLRMTLISPVFWHLLLNSPSA